MSTIKSSTEHLTLNADGAGKDIKFQANGVEKASISSAGAFTSTSIDATKLSGALPAIDGSALTNLPGGGKVLQVVSTIKTDTWSSNSTAFVDVTGLAVTITPTSATSTILVTATISYSAVNGSYPAIKMIRGTTEIFKGAVGSPGLEVSGGNNFNWSGNNEYGVEKEVITGMDSPATTSATTYKISFSAMRTSALLGYVNRSHSMGDDNQYRTASTITVMEIGA